MRRSILIACFCCMALSVGWLSRPAKGEEKPDGQVGIIASVPQEWLASLPGSVGKPVVQCNPLASLFQFARSDSGSIYIADEQERDSYQKVKFPPVHGMCLGQRRVAVIASKDVVADHIGREELVSVLQNGMLGRQQIKTVFVENEPYVQRVLQAQLQDRPDAKGGIRIIASPKSDLITVTTRADIVQAMPNARGCICLISLPLTGLEKGSKLLKLLDKSGKVIDHDSDIDDYWLSETLFVYLHKSASTESELLLRSLLCGEGQVFLASQGILTPKAILDARAEVRALDVKSGKGEKLAACGAVGGSNALAGRAAREMMGGLAEEFVRAKAVVQVGYTPMATDVAGMGAFLATTGAGEAMRPRQELLLLDDRPSERAMQAHGERWNALGKLRAAALRSAVDDDASPRAIDSAAGAARSQPLGADSLGTIGSDESAGVAVAEAVGYDDGPVEYLIAARGVAVIVNPSNKLNSLTLDQLRSVFSGELQDWSILAGGVGGGGAGGAGKQEIKLFGLPQADVVTQIFAVECLATNQWRRVTIRKSSDEVIKAVASDPAAIGIVDLATVGPVALAGLQSETAASAAGRSVKLLSIDLGRAAGGTGGLRGATMPPLPAIPATADNLKNAMYPLSQRLYLYVHPLASDTAKDFAKFVATCGASEATPYADTVKSMIETYQKNGLIPLADEAINRMAKDALAAATKED